MKKGMLLILGGVMCLFLSSCEKAFVENGEEENTEGKRIVLHLDMYDQLSFDDAYSTRAITTMDKVCTRINMAVFQEDTKVKTINQTIDNDNFGKLSFVLPQGEYEVVIIAHSGNSAATITSEKVTFPNNKVTDTFYTYLKLSVEESAEYTIQLKRAVAMFRLNVEDVIPDQVKQMKFYYTGGSSTFNAKTGYGCVNSKQTELRDVNEVVRSADPACFEVYTFPHAESGELKMTVSALNASNEIIVEKVFEKVPVTINQITQYAGHFFSSSPDDGTIEFVLHTDSSWQQIERNY